MTSDIKLNNLLKGIDTNEFWSYPGSFTTPPCTEGINWTVLADIQPISAA
jgi:carbonic anhydrase